MTNRPHYRLHFIPGGYWWVQDADGWFTRTCDTAREACERMRAGLVI